MIGNRIIDGFVKVRFSCSSPGLVVVRLGEDIGWGDASPFQYGRYVVNHLISAAEVIVSALIKVHQGEAIGDSALKSIEEFLGYTRKVIRMAKFVGKE